jgi:hypothetical protein
MFHFHCWHLVPGSERKIRNPKRCQHPEPEYVITKTYDICGRCGFFSYVRCQITEKCCICSKIRKRKEDYDPSVALNFPDIKEG